MNLADVHTEIQGSALVARLTGEVDLSNARVIGRALVAAVSNQTETVVLDLSQLQYLDSAGIQLIYQLQTQLRARRQQLRLVVPPDSPAADALRLAGIADQLEVPLFWSDVQ